MASCPVHARCSQPVRSMRFLRRPANQYASRKLGPRRDGYLRVTSSLGLGLSASRAYLRRESPLVKVVASSTGTRQPGPASKESRTFILDRGGTSIPRPLKGRDFPLTAFKRTFFRIHCRTHDVYTSLAFPIHRPGALSFRGPVQGQPGVVPLRRHPPARSPPACTGILFVHRTPEVRTPISAHS